MLMVLVPAVVGCAKDSSNGSASGTTVDIPASKFVDKTGQKEVDLDVKDNYFNPSYVVVSPGTKIVWTNNGQNTHDVVPVDDGSFDGVAPSQFGPGQVHSATFSGTGDYPYYCSIHGTKNLSGQAGVIRVEKAKST
jgi:plastocyanin